MEMTKKAWSIASVYLSKEKINTNPKYQRPAVWSTAQKQLLIDTIIRGYDIPKLYCQKVNKSPFKYEVIDGQQRLRAIWEFMQNVYKLPKDADDVEGCPVAGKKYDELPEEVRTAFDGYDLDFAMVISDDDEEVQEMFLRLQNGTTLKAQEKRNARPGKMRDFVCELAKHRFFDSVGFKNSRFTYDHVAAQMCCLVMSDEICNIKDRELNLMYENNVDFDEKSALAKKVQRILNFLSDVFPDKTPELKRYNVISMFVLIKTLIDGYVISGHEADIRKWFIDFEGRRMLDEAKSPEEQDPKFVVYHEKTAHSTDSFDSLEFRNRFLIEDLLAHLPGMAQKDGRREFDEYQRIAIYRRDGGKCQQCGVECSWDNWHADHITPWSKGGKTSVENGQVLCPSCNLAKSDK